MTVPAALTAVSIASTNNRSHTSTMHRNQHLYEQEVISALTRKSSNSLTSSPQQLTNETNSDSIGTLSKLRIPEKEKSNDDQLSPAAVKMNTSDSDVPSPSSSNVKPNSPPTRPSNEVSSVQPAKRKVSLSQYREQKRLKSSDTVQISSMDVDMRVHPTENNLQTSLPKSMSNDSTLAAETRQTASPSEENSNKGSVTKSNLSEPGVKKLIKKKVIWADEKSQALVQTSFFEIDDSEMTDMHAFARQRAANMSIAQVEKLMERDLRTRRGSQDASSLENDDKQNLPPLPTLIRILLPDTINSPIVKSQERAAQEEREKRVLQALFIGRFLPDTPREPDGDLVGTETTEKSAYKTIPLEDNAPSSAPESLSSPGSTSEQIPVSVSTHPANPTTSTLSSSPPSQNDVMSAKVAQIFATAKGNLASATMGSAPVNPTLTTAHDTNPVSTLLSAMLNMTRSNGVEPTNTVVPLANPATNPMFNLPVNFTLPPSINPLLAGALPFGLSSSTTFNNPMLPLTSAPFHLLSSSSNVPEHDHALPPSTAPFVPGPNQRLSAGFENNTNARQIKHFRESNRGHHHRRGFHNNTRRGFHHNRNKHNNSNRNVFS